MEVLEWHLCSHEEGDAFDLEELETALVATVDGIKARDTVLEEVAKHLRECCERGERGDHDGVLALMTEKLGVRYALPPEERG